MEKQLNSVTKTLSEIKETQNNLIQIINEQNETFKSLNTRFDNLLVEIKKLTPENTVLGNRTNALGNRNIQFDNRIRNYDLTSPLSKSANDFVNELMDRELRSTNVMLFNLPEGSESKYDDTKLKFIFNQMQLKFKISGSYRVGNSFDRPRPLKILLTERRHVFDVLRAQSKIRLLPEYKNLWFSTDLSVKQREHIIMLRSELDTRRKNGENNLVIKYVDGVPTIVSIQRTV